jgi:hypothetical protein
LDSCLLREKNSLPTISTTVSIELIGAPRRDRLAIHGGVSKKLDQRFKISSDGKRSDIPQRALSPAKDITSGGNFDNALTGEV